MVEKQQLFIEVAYAKSEEQVIIPMQVEEGTSVKQAVEASGILKRFPEIDLENSKVGIFGKACKPEQELQDGDRVEVYRPLMIDPKEHRRKKAAEGKVVKVDAED